MRKVLFLALILMLLAATSAIAAKPPAVNMDQQQYIAVPEAARDRMNKPLDGPVLSSILSTFIEEDFEGTFPPTGWTVESTVSEYTWNQDSGRSYSGSYSAYCPYNYDQSERFVTPAMDFSGAASDLRVEFYWQADYTWMVAPNDNADYELWISTDGGVTWSDMIWNEEDEGVFSYFTWYETSIDLSAYVGESNVKLSWLFHGSDANDVFLDYVVVTDDPPPQPPDNDNCEDVTPVVLIADSTYTFTGDNSNVTNDCDLLYYPEAWIAFTIEECMNVTIDYCGTTPEFSAYITLSDSCPCGNFISPFDYNYDDCGDDNVTMYFRGLLAGTYYYPIMMDPATNSVGEYKINVYGKECPERPENDDCEDVTPVSLATGDTLTFTGTNLGSTNDCDNMLQEQVWHAFTTTEIMDVKIDYCGTDPAFGTIYGELTQDCPCGDFIVYTVWDDSSCDDDNLAVYWYNLPAGTYYYPVAVDYWGDAEGEYVLNITGIAPEPAPSNDNCSDAELIGAVQSYAFSTLRASADGDGDCMDTKDIWFVFTAPITGSATVHTCGSDYNTKLAIYDGYSCDPFPELMTCDDDDYDNDCDYASRSIFDITEGNEYLIQVGGGSYDEFGEGVLTIEYGDPEIEIDPSDFDVRAAVDEIVDETMEIANNGNLTLHFDIGIDQHPFSATTIADETIKQLSYQDKLSLDQEQIKKMSFDTRPGFEMPDKNNYTRKGNGNKRKVILSGGEDIASAEVIDEFPYTDDGSTDGYSDDYDEACSAESDAPDVVYSYAPESDHTVSISLCESEYDTKVYVYEDSCTAGSPYACNDDGCGEGPTRSVIPSMDVYAGHTYYIVVDGWGESSGDYTLVLDDEIEPPANDECIDAIQIDGPFPATVYGNNLGATIDFIGTWGIYAVWYKVDLPYEYNNLEINYCETDGSISSIFGHVFTDCNDCYSYIYRNSVEWEDCGNDNSNPVLQWLSLPGPATYYIPVYFYLGLTYDYGITVDVSEFTYCEIDCPADAVAENEDCGDDNNGGCGEDETGDFQDITTDMTICGSAWADDGYRDTDWYRLDIDKPYVITITGMSEFPFQMLIIEHNSDETCEELETVNGFQSDPCEEGSMTSILHEGEWYIWAGPSGYQSAPCDGEGVFNNEYYFTISSELSWLSIDPGDGQIAPGESPWEIEVHMGAEGLPEDTYTGDIIVYSDDPEEDEITIPVSLVVSNTPTYEYLLGDANMAAETWPAQTIGGDVTYLVNYFRGLADPCKLDGFYASGDATGDCMVVGGDVTYLVNYFRGLNDLNYCADYVPAWPTPSDVPTDAPDGWPNCD